MSAAPDVLVRDGAGAYGPTPNGVDITPNNTISIKLTDTTDVDQWYLEVIGTDELSSTPTLTGVNGTTHLVASPSTVVTFPNPNFTGRALLFRSTVVSISTTASVAKTFCLFTLTPASKRVGATGLTREGNTTFGWAPIVNPLIRATGSALPPLIGTQYAVLMEDPIGTMVWQQVSQDMVLPSFAATLSGGTLKEIGESVVTPAFTAGYTVSPPDTAVLTDTEGSSPKNVVSTPTSFTSNGTFTKSTYGQTVTFTLTATKGAKTSAPTTLMTWVQKVYWDISSSSGPFNAAFVLAMTNSALATSRARSFTVTAGSGQKIYYAFRTAYGTPTFFIGGFEGGFEFVATVSVTNLHGVAENYDIWRSVQANLGPTTVTVT